MDDLCLDRRRTAFVGILGAALFSLMWLAAIYADGNWVLGAETLSELGRPSRAGHPLFNGAAVIAGMLLGIFARGMYNAHRTFSVARASMTIAMLACASLIGVGIFPIHVTGYHTVVSLSFFGLMAIAISVWMIHDWTRNSEARPYAYFTALLLIVNALFMAMTEIGMAEAIAVISIMVWTVLQGLRLLK